MSYRALALQEMGLGPIWRLRGTADEEIAPASGASRIEPPVTPPIAPRPSPTAVLRAPVITPVAPVAPEITPADPQRATRIAAFDWPALQAAVAGCTACGLHATRTQTVFGVGAREADWMVIGEAPGAEEDARGEPFVGQAGQLLDAMLAAIRLSRTPHAGQAERAQSIFIANVLKCRPPGNRNPAAAEVAQCAPHLQRQIALVNPKVILLMGRFAAQTVLGVDATIASLRGKVHQVDGRAAIVTYHPAYLLRSLTDKARAWEDLCLAMQTMQTRETA